jgi:hypothetical protein
MKHSYNHGAKWLPFENTYCIDDSCKRCGCIRHRVLINTYADERTMYYFINGVKYERAPDCEPLIAEPEKKLNS